MVWSFRTALIPQCRTCGAAATDPDGRTLVVTDSLLPEPVRARLRREGWTVTAGEGDRVRRSALDVIGGDILECGTCSAAQAAATAAYAAKTTADLARPRVRVLDLSARLGAGVTLSQRDGDAERHRWLVEKSGEVRGYVNRYKRKGRPGFSAGWEAWYRLGDQGFFRREAISACQYLEHNSVWTVRRWT